ncbi:uncharacterized protein SPPG_05405 [Spizellomyces punctatus DAOM BR117]|uniref:Uncharacterized protein n=1 Tax=Spizellomyces punctatus (strain DAOM BR117) TaxID=645134 RepID=A0A0L0HDE3_SPIPD|nr:uncharacterized protein SPPG_05405 [Spizellomyces punctatus DAOM BR117]KNC99147.1 hypothetical protein SPPG_05405 [Spizellomyces punctatus DAOM BR117]|eukprot:XP_016607187.1 hypothetical protein SPPG_05405 [Spizellomyces punctatus DAOM BR117]
MPSDEQNSHGTGQSLPKKQQVFNAAQQNVGRPRGMRGGKSVSEVVRLLHANLDKKHAGAPPVIPPVVRNRIAAFEGPEVGKIQKKLEPKITQNMLKPPMTPSRRAAIAARRVTRATFAELKNGFEEDGDGHLVRPEWPDVKARKALFEPISGEINGQDNVPGRKVPRTPTRKSRRLTTGSMSDDFARKNNEEFTGALLSVENTLKSEAITYPSPFDDVPAASDDMKETQDDNVPTTPSKSKSTVARSARKPKNDESSKEPSDDAITPPKIHAGAEETMATPRTPTRSAARGSARKPKRNDDMDQSTSDEQKQLAATGSPSRRQDAVDQLKKDEGESGCPPSPRPIKTPTRASARIAALSSNGRSPRVNRGPIPQPDFSQSQDAMQVDSLPPRYPESAGKRKRSSQPTMEESDQATVFTEKASRATKRHRTLVLTPLKEAPWPPKVNQTRQNILVNKEEESKKTADLWEDNVNGNMEDDDSDEENVCEENGNEDMEDVDSDEENAGWLMSIFLKTARGLGLR